ncbi:MAG TPA: GNAT family N-acetyltransferase [Flavisolibacter sp.]|jgi:drug/metabolite transporter (DMT)-like permease/ribosomal protein S18 acetylase RimI-like enzyme|nr:GNAT family N-acetyltransferase [Flavisolibacter sp.]
MNQSNKKAYVALAIVCLVWSTTFLALRIGVTTFPPFLFAAIRHLLAGGLLFLFIFFCRFSLRISRKELQQQVVAGVLLVALGNGMISWAERHIPSGLAALISAMLPVYVALINVAWGKATEKVNGQVVKGMLLGGAGLAFIFKDNLSNLTNSDYLAGIVATLIASFCWAFGTVYTKYKRSSAHAFVNAAIQMCSGGLVLLFFSAVMDDFSELSSVSLESLGAMAYLIVFGSVISYGCYLFALERLPAVLTSAYAYVTPVVAVLLGYLLLDETFTGFTLMACLSIVSGVYLMNRSFIATLKTTSLSMSTPNIFKEEEITIVHYRPELQIHFERLNRAWILQSFHLEPVDEWVLAKPEEAIIKNGGSVLFARKGEQVIGTVGIKRVNEDTFEMTKMAVDERFRGAGAGKRLIAAAIQEASRRAAHRLILYSNTRANATAIHLYRKLGFAEIPLESGVYERADIKMELLLKVETQQVHYSDVK